MRKQIVAVFIGMLVLLGVSGYSHAALIDRGGGMIFDTDRNITWLQDANFAMTSGYDADGLMTWDQAKTWAANLNYGGYSSGWRLPTALNADGSGQCGGYNCTGSEMGHLFYNELEGVAGVSILTMHDSDFGLFSNMQAYNYWLAEYVTSTGNPWNFTFGDGYQVANYKDYNFPAWAVRDGDVSAVPEPGTLLLLGSGLVGLIAFRRKMSR